MTGLYEELSSVIAKNPANYTIMECVLASGLAKRAEEYTDLQARYERAVDMLLDAELRYERSFIGRL